MPGVDSCYTLLNTLHIAPVPPVLQSYEFVWRFSGTLMADSFMCDDG